MNRYKDNLRTTVLSVLEEQELEQKKLGAQRNAALFHHYYTQGERIVALDKLEISHQELVSKEKINEQAVNIISISNKLLDFAEQEKRCVEQAVTDTSVAAVNIQIATNAIVKLASDITSVFDIVSGLDFDTEIYILAKNASELIKSTAYNAEMVSQVAMKASVSTAEISSNTVFDKAKATNALVEKLFKFTTLELETVSNKVKADNVLFGQTRNKEKRAEGNLKANNISWTASKLAFHTQNKELNINLSVLEKAGSSDSYTISFDAIKSPFKKEIQPLTYPIERYFVFLVKEKNKNIFNLDKAGQIVSKGVNNKDFKEVDEFHNTVQFAITKKTLNDTDQEEIRLGEQYVIFVFGIYKTKYKKAINNFEDFLSTPSLPFRFSHSLIGPDIKTFEVQEERIITPFNETIETTFSFRVPTTKSEDISTVYRCMFLPSHIAMQVQFNDLEHVEPYFNLLLAEQVSKGNYILAALYTGSSKKGKANTETYVAKLEAESTDVFGNIMVKGNSYTPVVLSIPSVKYPLWTEYSNAISNAIKTKPFVFQKPAD